MELTLNDDTELDRDDVAVEPVCLGAIAEGGDGLEMLTGCKPCGDFCESPCGDYCYCDS
jgi:hypothetical protein